MFVCLFVWGRCVGVSGSCSVVYVYELLIYQQFSSVQDGSYVLGNAHRRSTPASQKVSPMLPLKFYLPFIQQTQKPPSQLSHDHYLVDESTHGREHRHMKQHPDLRTALNVVLGTETTNHHNHNH